MSTATQGNGRPSPQKLYRDTRHKLLCGVCAGVSDYFGIDRMLVRGITVAGLVLVPAPTLLAYVVGCFALSPRPDDLYRNETEQRFWQDVRRSPKDTFSRTKHKFMQLEHRLRKLEAYVTSSQFELEREIKKVGD